MMRSLASVLSPKTCSKTPRREAIGPFGSGLKPIPLFASRENGLPVEDRVPHEAVIAAIEVAVKWIEIERDDVTASDGEVENRRPANQPIFAPRLSAHHEQFFAS